jgi:competence protein ComEC
MKPLNAYSGTLLRLVSRNRKIYQIFVMGNGRVEIFFALSVLASVLTYPNVYAGAFVSAFLPFIFIRKRYGAVLALAVLALHLFAANSLLITGVKSEDSGKLVYTTTGGTLVTAQSLTPGDMLFGGYSKRAYAGEEEGRYSGGYNIADRSGYVLRLPVAGGILGVRQELTDRMFRDSGGLLRLTQGVVLGDKKYITPEVSDMFFQTGLGHLLAISGLHVGLYAMLVYFVTAYLPYKLRLVLVSLVLLALIPLTGFKIPVLRAGLIGICVALAKIADYKTDTKKLLFFMAGIFILISPPMVASPSFLLSFSAVYGLLNLDRIKAHRYLMPIFVGLAASAFIIPASSVLFGTHNISSVFSTPLVVPILSAQVITAVLYFAMPSLFLEPLILLEKLHIAVVDLFADHLGFMFTLYKTELFWAFMMGVFLILCVRLRVFWLSFALLFVPYLPQNVADGGYFPNMGRSKGFVVKDEKVHIFFRGDHGSFVYDFMPYLAEIGVSRADTGRIEIFGSDNIFIPIDSQSDDFGWVCVNKVDENCKAVYHTKSDSYKCDDGLIHVLYKNKCRTEKTFLLAETGDIRIENKSE